MNLKISNNAGNKPLAVSFFSDTKRTFREDLHYVYQTIFNI